MLDQAKHVHFVGIGGIGMSAAAKWFLLHGKTVSGSDRARSALTDRLVQMGARVVEGHATANLPAQTSLLVYSTAVPAENPEREEAAKRGIPQISYAEFLGELSRTHSTIVVCGTNGKSTTTAMLGRMLEEAGYDPTVIVGSLVPGFPHGNIRVGHGRFFVVEGCEYKSNFLAIEPEMVVITNIEEDHLDYFRDIDHIRETFQKMVDKLKGKGFVVWNADDVQSRRLQMQRGVRFGATSEDAQYRVSGRVGRVGEQDFVLYAGAEPAGPVVMRVPGAFNALNAAAATAAAMEMGVPFETCTRVLAGFNGIWRRFERVGTWNGADVISDYGHHPTAIRGTIDAAREFFPGRRVVLCFQPHQHSRTHELFDGFVQAIGSADVIVLPEIYRVEGRTEDDSVSSKDIAVAIQKLHPEKPVRFAADLGEAEMMLSEIVMSGDVLIIQGAGDVDTLARKVVD